MKTKTHIFYGRFLAIVLILCLFSAIGATGVTAQAQSDDEEEQAENDLKVLRNNQTFQPSLENQLSDQALQQAYYLMKIRDELGNAKDGYSGLSNAISRTKSALDETQGQFMSLKDQILHLDALIDESNKKITAVFLQVSALEQDIAGMEHDFGDQYGALESQQAFLKEYVKMLYEQERGLVPSSMGGFEDTEIDLNALSLLLSGDSVQETLKNLKYLEIMDRTGRGIITRATQSLELLQKKKIQLDEKHAKLMILKERLKNERSLLEEQKVAKAELIKATKGQEKIYDELLAQSLEQQKQSLEEIQVLRKNYAYVEQKIQETGGKGDMESLQRLIDQKVAAIYEFQQQQGSEDGWKWPVSATNGITAFFHDGGYVKTFGVAHQAIDIRATQRTPIRAPMDAIVYKVKDNDNSNYSYVILAHRDNFQTVYGHINQSLVKEGDTVKAGDVFAFSGGMPGSKGAGFMTTGPHLHFEMLKNGQHVDPLDYLPLMYLPLDSIPQKYLEKLHAEQARAAAESTADTTPEQTPYKLEDIESIIEQAGTRE